MKHSCPHCGKEINPAAMLGKVRTPKREASWKANGERLKRAYDELRRVKTTLGRSSESAAPGFSPDATPEIAMLRPSEAAAATPLPANATLAEKKAAAFAALASIGNRSGMSSLASNSIIPDGIGKAHAPFDFKDDDGNPHRVRAYGKTLKVCFLRDGVEEPIRNLAPGELEILWEKRIR